MQNHFSALVSINVLGYYSIARKYFMSYCYEDLLFQLEFLYSMSILNSEENSSSGGKL